MLSTAFSYARYAKGMEELTRFGTKNISTLPSLANIDFNSLGDGNDVTIYTNTDTFTRHFVRQSIEEGCFSILIQYYNSTISDEVFKIDSKELNIHGKIGEILDKFFEYTNKHRKTIENQNDSQFEDYGDINQEEKTKHNNKELNKLAILKILQKLNLNDVMTDFDATSLDPSAVPDDN